MVVFLGASVDRIQDGDCSKGTRETKNPQYVLGPDDMTMGMNQGSLAVPKRMPELPISAFVLPCFKPPNHLLGSLFGNVRLRMLLASSPACANQFWQRSSEQPLAAELVKPHLKKPKATLRE